MPHSTFEAGEASIKDAIRRPDPSPFDRGTRVQTFRAPRARLSHYFFVVFQFRFSFRSARSLLLIWYFSGSGAATTSVKTTREFLNNKT